MPTNAFYPSLNDFCKKYFVVGPKPLSAEDVRQLPARAVAECAALFFDDLRKLERIENKGDKPESSS